MSAAASVEQALLRIVLGGKQFCDSGQTDSPSTAAMVEVAEVLVFGLWSLAWQPWRCWHFAYAPHIPASGILEDSEGYCKAAMEAFGEHSTDMPYAAEHHFLVVCLASSSFVSTAAHTRGQRATPFQRAAVRLNNRWSPAVAPAVSL